jgi:hypothetical protein
VNLRVPCIDEHRKVEQMEHWGIYVAYGWLATIILALTDAVQAIRKGPQSELQPSDHTPTTSDASTDVTDGATQVPPHVSDLTEVALVHKVAA